MIAHFKIKKMIEIQFSEMYEYCKNSSRSFLAQRGEIITDMKRTIESFNKTVKYQASLGSDLTKDNVALAAKRNLFDIYQALKTVEHLKGSEIVYFSNKQDFIYFAGSLEKEMIVEMGNDYVSIKANYNAILSRLFNRNNYIWVR